MKILVFSIALIMQSSIYSMEFLTLSRYQDSIAAPAVLGVTLVGMGISRGVKTYLKTDSYDAVINGIAGKISVEKNYDQPFVMIITGISILKLITSDTFGRLFK